MEHIARSLAAMVVLVAAAFIYVLGTAFLVGAFATATPSTLGTVSDLLHAATWLQFAAGVTALIAVCAAGWELVLRSAWWGAFETGVAAVATLLIAIGLLIGATSELASSAGDVIVAVGIGVWAVVALIHAARSSLAEQMPGGTGAEARQAAFWLIASGGLFVFAVGSGLTVGVAAKGTAIAAGVLEAVGAAVLCLSVAAASVSGSLRSRAVPAVLGGLGLLTAAGVALSVVASLVFGPNATLTGLRIGPSIVTAILLTAIAALGLGAWSQVRELARTQLMPVSREPSPAPKT